MLPTLSGEVAIKAAVRAGSSGAALRRWFTIAKRHGAGVLGFAGVFVVDALFWDMASLRPEVLCGMGGSS